MQDYHRRIHAKHEHNRLQARRQFLKTSGMGLGVTALASLLPQNSVAQSAPDRTPRAKHVIFLFMAGAPSQIDLFDYKPDLEKLFKQPLPESISMGQRVTAMTKGQTQLVAPSMFKFHRKGENGIWMCELLPHLSEVADDLCIINSMHTNAINHDPAKTFICTGSEIPGKASMGAWLSYGLGSMNRDLPDFIVLTSAYWTGGTRNVQALYSRLWGSGFLPSQHQGVAFQTSGDPVLFLSNPNGIDTRRPAPDARHLGPVEPEALRRDRRSRDSDDHRPAGIGLPHAGVRSRTDGHLRRIRTRHGSRTDRKSTRTAPLPATACSPGGWSNAACASSRSFTAGGITTRFCRSSCRASASMSTSRPRRC